MPRQQEQGIETIGFSASNVSGKQNSDDQYSVSVQ
jgi:hypothetical protein